VTAEAAAFAAPVAEAERAARLRVVAGWLWSGALLAVLTFLVLYPVAMLLLGALTNTNPVVDGFGVFDLSLDNFVSVLGNSQCSPCAGELADRLHRGYGARGRDRACVFVDRRTYQHAVERLHRRSEPGSRCSCRRWSRAWRGRSWVSPKSGLLNTMMKWIGVDWRIDLYSMAD
jgi:iron(III) transport system permease protein